MADATANPTAGVFRLRLVAPEGIREERPVRSLTVASEDGRLGILYNHAPLVAALWADRMEIVGEDGRREAWAVSDGFLEVVDNVVTVLVDAAERADEIDVERAERARRRAQERLERRGDPAIDSTRAAAALRRALARLKTAGGS